MLRDQILHFFKFFYYFLRYVQNQYFSENCGPSKISDFVPILKNSKKILKNVKFDLEAHFNVDIMLSSLDLLIGP